MARVYCGTYAKYNNGSIAGDWLDLEDYSDHDEFLEACKALHADESDPEFMFQDYEDFPSKFYSESSIKADLWDWLELDESDRDMCAAYWDGEDESADIEYIREAFQGTADSEAEYAEQLAEDTGMIDAGAKWPYTCIDWERAARDLFMDGYSLVRYEGIGYVFLAH